MIINNLFIGSEKKYENEQSISNVKDLFMREYNNFKRKEIDHQI